MMKTTMETKTKIKMTKMKMMTLKTRRCLRDEMPRVDCDLLVGHVLEGQQGHGRGNVVAQEALLERAGRATSVARKNGMGT